MKSKYSIENYSEINIFRRKIKKTSIRIPSDHYKSFDQCCKSAAFKNAKIALDNDKPNDESDT